MPENSVSTHTHFYLFIYLFSQSAHQLVGIDTGLQNQKKITTSFPEIANIQIHSMLCRAE
jgi:hypothetical protein